MKASRSQCVSCLSGWSQSRHASALRHLGGPGRADIPAVRCAQGCDPRSSDPGEASRGFRYRLHDWVLQGLRRGSGRVRAQGPEPRPARLRESQPTAPWRTRAWTWFPSRSRLSLRPGLRLCRQPSPRSQSLTTSKSKTWASPRAYR